MNIEVLVDFLKNEFDNNQNFFIEAEGRTSRIEGFIDCYNKEYSPQINKNSQGIIDLEESKDKWGLELRLYVKNCPQNILDNFNFSRNECYREEYKYRLNDNKIINELFVRGFRLGMN